MAKYGDEFKLKVVCEFLRGKLSYERLAAKHKLGHFCVLQRWVQAYKAFGLDGLRRKQTKEVYPVQFKLDVLHFMKNTGASYQDTAIRFRMNNPTLIANWNSKFQKEGVEGLKDKGKGRPSMSKKPKSSRKEGKLVTSEEQLKRENELLRLEIAYLKKLYAFQENPNAFLAKHKQQWHSNSNNKDSN